MAKKSWAYRPRKHSKSKVPDTVKQTLKAKADELVKTVLMPQHVKPPSPDNDLNYVANIYTKWYRHYFYFCTTYNVRGPHATAPSFEAKFARLEYVSADSFNLAFMRYTGQWVEIAYDISFDEALEMIQDDPLFHP
jgi:hypothetical protein